MKPINKISPRQLKIKRLWGRITLDRMKLLAEIFGTPICERCGQPGINGHPIKCLGGHHLVKRQYNVHTPEVCFIAHWGCHDGLEQQPALKVEQFSFMGAPEALRVKLLERLEDYKKSHDL